MTKSGTGTARFSGTTANTYTGATTVTAGTLEFVHRAEHLPIYLIFDILPLAKNPAVLVCPREKCFAPIKTLEDAKFWYSSRLDS